MAHVNQQTREITCKIVYYGPAMSGKTTNLRWLHRLLRPEFRGELISINTAGDRTLFMDTLPVQLGSIGGFSTKLNIYSVPGQRHYAATRKLVLDGADAVVFVADAQESMLSENASAFADLHEQIAGYGQDPLRVPMVMQYNKLDLPPTDRTPIDALDRLLNARALPIVPAAAIDGTGVYRTLEVVTQLVFQRLQATHAPSARVA